MKESLQRRTERTIHRKWSTSQTRKKHPPKNSRRQPIKKKQKREIKKNRWINLSLFLLLIFTIFFILKVKTHQIDGHSMEPTFKNGDRILVAKKQKPTRYSIVTFEPSTAKGESYVKRVIGMPGDIIWVEGNSLYINQQADNNPKNLFGQDLKADELPDGTIRVALTPDVARQLSSYYKIPEEMYFVQGDNRNHSNDSRAIGLVNLADIEGVATFRYYPFNKMGMIH